MSSTSRKRSRAPGTTIKQENGIKEEDCKNNMDCKVVLTRMQSQPVTDLEDIDDFKESRQTRAKAFNNMQLDGHQQDDCLPNTKRRRMGNSGSSDSVKSDCVGSPGDDEIDSLGNLGDKVMKSNGVMDKAPKIRTDNKAAKDKARTCNGNGKSIKKTKSKGDRCRDCLQFFDDPDLKTFCGDSPNAVDEMVALTDKRLSLFTGCESDDMLNEYKDNPNHKVTCFTVYDQHNHICQFDVGLIEREVKLWFSGFVKPIYSEDESPTDGIAVKKVGPINEWWTTGFDGGDRALIGLSTEYCDYIVMKPSPEYLPYMHSALEKIHMSKYVIEIVSNNLDTTFDDLLETVQSMKPPKGVPPFSQDALVAHAQFIVEQIKSYDLAGDDDEPLLLTTPCIRSLIKIAGATLNEKAPTVSKRRQEKPIRKPKKPISDTKATTTSLVHKIIGMAFGEKIVEEFKKSKLDCIDSAVREAEEDESQSESESESENEDSKENINKQVKPAASTSKSRGNTGKLPKDGIKWIGQPVHTSGKQVIYDAVSLRNKKLVPEDFVKVEARNSQDVFEIAKIAYLFEDDEGCMMFHAHYFMLGKETLLGDTADKREIFMIDNCEDVPLSFVIDGINVFQKSPPPNWFHLGGIDDPDVDVVKSDDNNSFFYQKWYDPVTARFLDPPEIDEDTVQENGHFFCSSCYQIYLKDQKEIPAFGQKTTNEMPDSKHDYYSSVSWRDTDFHVGDCVYLEPKSFSFRVMPQPQPKNPTIKEKYDEEMYPELYRKSSDYSRGICNDINEPFQIGRIISISKYTNCTKVHAKNVSLRIGVFYRPENTHLSAEDYRFGDLNLLYYSNEEASVKLANVTGKCHVTFSTEAQNCYRDFHLTGICIFYFSKMYDSKTKVFSDCSTKISSLFTSKQDFTNAETKHVPNKLRMLDVFAGCGGLSEGFHQVGIAETKWAIEFDEAAAEAFRQNNPNCTVFNENCNKLLKEMMKGQETDRLGQSFPKKGEIDMIVGGPPCQGFSGMNRFNYRQYSAFKNSLIATYLSYCDYFRPKFFALENVRNFVAFKKNMVLKLTMTCLIRMGYQCTFGILQAGNYGVPQSRRRAIIIAVAPGEKLPFYPEPTNVFANRVSQISTVVDDKKYVSNIKWTSSAPFRMVTVRDTMSDLPPILNGARKEELSYTGPPRSSFQKMVRSQVKKEVLRDHVCKYMHPLVEARLKHIPRVPGSDWRDLPNIVVELPNGQFTKKLKYNYHDKKNGKSYKGAKRGVCSCAEGRSCDPVDRQSNTLIPWCLPHTSNRHAQWAGLYGRLNLDGYFCTTVTNPEPMGKQGLVVHPKEDRVVSVRECARSQGFPDSYVFNGAILDRHKQIGNAVPPPLAAAIALEFKKSIMEN